MDRDAIDRIQQFSIPRLSFPRLRLRGPLARAGRLGLLLALCLGASAAVASSAVASQAGGFVVEYGYQEKEPMAAEGQPVAVPSPNTPSPNTPSPIGPSPDAPAQTSALRLDVEGDRVLISFPVVASASQERPALRLLYLGDRRMLVLLDDGEKTFKEVDGDILVVLEQHLDQQDTDQRIRLLQMSAVPRRLMAEVLAKEEAVRARRLRWSPWEVESTGRWAEQQGFRSLAYAVRAEGEPLGELWVAEVDATELDDGALATLRRSSILIDQLLMATSKMATGDSLTLLGFESNPLAMFAFQRGLPVVLRRIVDGTVKYEKILQSIRPRQSDDAPVDIPVGYRRGILGLQ